MFNFVCWYLFLLFVYSRCCLQDEIKFICGAKVVTLGTTQDTRPMPRSAIVQNSLPSVNHKENITLGTMMLLTSACHRISLLAGHVKLYTMVYFCCRKSYIKTEATTKQCIEFEYKGQGFWPQEQDQGHKPNITWCKCILLQQSNDFVVCAKSAAETQVRSLSIVASCCLINTQKQHR